jgi:hypothetical protein
LLNGASRGEEFILTRNGIHRRTEAGLTAAEGIFRRCGIEARARGLLVQGKSLLAAKKMVDCGEIAVGKISIAAAVKRQSSPSLIVALHFKLLNLKEDFNCVRDILPAVFVGTAENPISKETRIVSINAELRRSNVIFAISLILVGASTLSRPCPLPGAPSV